MRLFGPTGMSSASLRIPVVVADEHAEAAVGIRVPAFVGGRDAGAALARRIERQVRLRALRAGGDGPARHDGEARGHRPATMSREHGSAPFCSMAGTLHFTFRRPAIAWHLAGDVPRAAHFFHDRNVSATGVLAIGNHDVSASPLGTHDAHSPCSLSVMAVRLERDDHPRDLLRLRLTVLLAGGASRA